VSVSTARPVGRTRETVAAGYGLAVVRIVLGIIWLHESAWKTPPGFGEAAGGGLFEWTNFAIEFPVFAPYTAVVEAVVLPNFAFFGWLVFLGEAALGAFLIVGLLTRLWGAIGLAQALAITFSVISVPGEWSYAYYLLVAAHLAVLAGGAGRELGLDGVLRPRWGGSGSPLARLGRVLS